jgi:hypothetical protein
MAISSPLLEDVSIQGATGILINITGGPDLTLHEVNEASTLIQNAAHEDANIIFGSVIDPNLTDEVRITVIATGFDRAPRMNAAPEPSGPVPTRRTSQQVTLPYETANVTPRDYSGSMVAPAVMPSASRKMSAEPRPPAVVIDDADVDVAWTENELSAVEQALSALQVEEPVPEREPSARVAMGSGPSAADSAIPAPVPQGKRGNQSRPMFKAILGDDGDHELDVPTFIRNAQT